MFISGFTIDKILSNNSHELFKPNGQVFRVNVHLIRPYGTSKGQKSRQSVITELHNCHGLKIRVFYFFYITQTLQMNWISFMASLLNAVL